jgi:hypothetical protein
VARSQLRYTQIGHYSIIAIPALNVKDFFLKSPEGKGTFRARKRRGMLAPFDALI